jgi:sec-independent protein translocase protein TatA
MEALMLGVGFLGLGVQELLIILLIVVVLFGASKLPQLARGLGQSAKEFRKGISEDAKEEVAEKKQS